MCFQCVGCDSWIIVLDFVQKFVVWNGFVVGMVEVFENIGFFFGEMYFVFIFGDQKFYGWMEFVGVDLEDGIFILFM